MVDGEMEVLVVLEVRHQVVRVLLPDRSVEDWPLSSLPRGVVEGDRVGVNVVAGDLEMVLLPEQKGLRA